MDAPITSTRDVSPFVPILGQDGEGTPIPSPRTFLLAPLSWRQRIGFRAELAREAGHFPSNDEALTALRQAVLAAGPSNASELVAVLDVAQAEPGNEEAQTQLRALQAHFSAAPAYAALMAQRGRYMDTLPWVAARHALRGWEGPDLPEFRQERGLVPYDLLEQLDINELTLVGFRANDMGQVNRRAEGNSPSASPSPETPAPAAAS